MKRRLLFYGMALLLLLPIRAQHNGLDSLYRKVREFGIGVPQEKVYLHLDNTCYFIGDTIWYKGYVTRSDRGTLTDLSQILYVELLTPDGYSVERQQLKMKNGTAHGAFVLKDSLYAGYYELRAYTRWMLNFGQYEYPRINKRHDFYNDRLAKDFFRDYEKLYSRVFPVFDRPKEEGVFAKDMTLRPMRRYYKKPREKKPKLDLRFYPEGGNLVEGTNCRIALELNDEDGMHLENINIAVTGRNGKDTVRCRTDERGRAVFILPDVSGEANYRAVFSYQGYDFEEKLPEVEETGCALAVVQNDTAVVATIQAQSITQPLALHVMCQGVSHFYQPLKMAQQQQQTAPPERGAGPKGLRGLTTTKANIPFRGKMSVDGDADVDVGVKPLSRYATAPLSGGAVSSSSGYPYVIQVPIPLDSLPTGVNQLTVFDGEGRIYADRLFFVNHHDYDAPLLDVSGIQQQYEPFDSITLHLRLTHPEDTVAGFSLSVRDRATEEPSNDNGTMLTEMLLASEIKGFVENPGYYFEADDSLHRQALDRLLMVQGWRRYGWMEMARVAPLKMQWLPEVSQTISGSVSRAEDGNPASPHASNLQKEVNVWTLFTQNGKTKEFKQTTQNGTFYMRTPEIFGEYMLFLSAADLGKTEEYVTRKREKGFTDEEAWPDYYVRLDHFHPHFAHPYNYYQDAPPRDLLPDFFNGNDSLFDTFSNRWLSTVDVYAKRNGLRQYDPSRPAIVVDAYEAYNLYADCGFPEGDKPFYYVKHHRYNENLAFLYLGDMGIYRNYFLQIRQDGRPIKEKYTQQLHDANLHGTRIGLATVVAPRPKTRGFRYADSYRRLSRLDKIYIYTDYVPRERGSWKYQQSNQPEVIIDYRLYPDEGYMPACRDRRYLLRGYAVCEEFYSPDYSRRPLPGTKDHRRTMLWMPEVKFDKNGEATVRLYNNGKATSLSIEAEGITAGGKFIQYKNIRP